MANAAETDGDAVGDVSGYEDSGRRFADSHSERATNESRGALSISEAHRMGNHPERLTPLISPRPSDLVAFEANPQQYFGCCRDGSLFPNTQGSNAAFALFTTSRTAFDIGSA
ncbi:MAG TPA: hypothetical protein VGL59_18785 [Polyangia bacterium]